MPERAPSSAVSPIRTALPPFGFSCSRARVAGNSSGPGVVLCKGTIFPEPVSSHYKGA